MQATADRFDRDEIIIVTSSVPPPSDASDPPERASQRGTSNFERQILPEIDLLYRAARSLTRSAADAEDLVQETLLRAFRAIDSFDGRYPRAWLLTIMRNANINNARKKRPDLLDDPDLAEQVGMFTDSDTPETTVIAGTFDSTIDQAFATLSDDFRQVVELVDLHGLAYQEAADLLDVPVGTVMSRLHRARKRIRDTIADTGLDSQRSIG